MINIYLSCLYIVSLTLFVQGCSVERTPMSVPNPDRADNLGGAGLAEDGDAEKENRVLDGSGKVKNKDETTEDKNEQDSFVFRPPKKTHIETQQDKEDKTVQDCGVIQNTETMQDAADVKDASEEEAIQDSNVEQDSFTENDLDAAISTDSGGEKDAQTFCDGTKVFNLCWYLTSTGVSCDQHCQNHGGFDEETASYIGTSAQGGCLENCIEVLEALGYFEDVTSGTRSDSLGFGCHVWMGSGAWWLSRPDFSPTVFGNSVKIVCACNQ